MKRQFNQLCWMFPAVLCGCALVVSNTPRGGNLILRAILAQHSQAVVAFNDLASIATLSIDPYVETTTDVYLPISSVTGNPTTEDDPNRLRLVQASPSINPSRPFVFKNLRVNKKYRIYGRAYSQANALISVDASSFVNVTVGTDDRPSIANLPLLLTDIPFNGIATSAIQIANGGYSFDGVTHMDFLRNITTVAGNGTSAYSGDDGPATAASLKGPWGMAIDAQGNIFIADTSSGRIRKVNKTTGIITTVAGNGIGGYSGDGGPATAAKLSGPRGVAVDSLGNIFIADTANKRIRKVDATTGDISTVAGNGTAAYSGDEGAATVACINTPQGVAIDALDNLFIGDQLNNRVRKVDKTTGIITTVAGNGTAGYGGDEGPATAAIMNGPRGLAFDSHGNLYIAESDGYRVRKVDKTTGIITTVAGNGTLGNSGDGGPATAAMLGFLRGLAFDSQNNLYIADPSANYIRRVDALTGVITTVAGNGTSGYSGDEGPATAACLKGPLDVAIDAVDSLFIADTSNNRIRKVW